jgi:hypothetical protein
MLVNVNAGVSTLRWLVVFFLILAAIEGSPRRRCGAGPGSAG